MQYIHLYLAALNGALNLFIFLLDQIDEKVSSDIFAGLIGREIGRNVMIRDTFSLYRSEARREALHFSQSYRQTTKNGPE